MLHADIQTSMVDPVKNSSTGMQVTLTRDVTSFFVGPSPNPIGGPEATKLIANLVTNNQKKVALGVKEAPNGSYVLKYNQELYVGAIFS